MRAIGEQLDTRLSSPLGTKAYNADPAPDIKLRRVQTVLSSGRDLEKILIADAHGTVTDCAVAVRHLSSDETDGEVWAAMADGGRLRVFRSDGAEGIHSHGFRELDCPDPAVSCALAFDAVTEELPDGRSEFFTYRVPYVFFVDPDGALHARLWGANEDTILASSNVARVSAVRSPSCVRESFDPGLCVFFLTRNGHLYYRQFIGNVWYDAEEVTFGPSAVFVDIAAFRTWDYRVGVQGITADGEIYEIFSQYEGIGVRCQEHLAVTGVSVEHTLLELSYRNGYETEHLSVADVDETHALWLAGAPVIVYAYEGGFGLEDFYPGEEDVPIDYD